MPYKTVRKFVPGHYIKVKIWVSNTKSKNKPSAWQDLCRCGKVKTKESLSCKKCYLDSGCKPIRTRFKESKSGELTGGESE